MEDMTDWLIRRENSIGQEETADEMFKELGYMKYDNHPEHDLPPEPNMFSTQDCRVIEYVAKEIINKKDCEERIRFEIIGERIVTEAFLNGYRIGVVPFNAKEIQAINKKCQELGWTK